jgi:hypothetical protein
MVFSLVAEAFHTQYFLHLPLFKRVHTDFELHTAATILNFVARSIPDRLTTATSTRRKKGEKAIA